MKRLLGKKWLLFTGLLSIVFLPTMLVLAAFMLPTMAAVAVDRTKERYLAMGIGSLNFCGSLPAVVMLWEDGQSLAVAMGILGDVMLWLASYGASGLGWLIYLSAHPILASIYGATATQRMQGLRDRREKLLQLWGEAVTSSGEAAAKPQIGQDVAGQAASQSQEDAIPQQAAAR